MAARHRTAGYITFTGLFAEAFLLSALLVLAFLSFLLFLVFPVALPLAVAFALDFARALACPFVFLGWDVAVAVAGLAD